MFKYQRVLIVVVVLHLAVGLRIVTHELGSFYRAPKYASTAEDTGEIEPPVPGEGEYQDFREYTATDGKINYGLMIEPQEPPEGAQVPYPRFYLALGGNGSTAAESAFVYRNLAEQTGCGFFMPDYRGYGFNDGDTSEEGIISDVVGAYDTLKAEGYFDEGVAVIGHSLGGGAAIALAQERPVERLLIVSSFTSGKAVAKLRYRWPMNLFVGNPWPNAERLKEIVARPASERPQDIYIIHGKRDALVPFEMAEELAAIVGGQQTLISSRSAGHNNIFMRRRRAIANLMKAGTPRRIEGGS